MHMCMICVCEYVRVCALLVLIFYLLKKRKNMKLVGQEVERIWEELGRGRKIIKI